LLVYPLILLCFNNDNLQYKKFFKIIFIVLIFVSFIVNDINIIIKILNKDLVNFLSLEQINPFGIYAQCMCFFILGGILHKFKLMDRYPKNQVIILSLLSIALGTAGLVLIRYTFTGTLTFDGVFIVNGNNYLSPLIEGIGMSLLFQTIDIKGNKVINFISQNTLGIFYLSGIIITLVCEYITYNGIFQIPIKVITTILICTLICYGMKKIKYIKEIFN